MSSSCCARRPNPTTRFHRNQQYSVTALTDATGSIVERYAYTAYGQPTFLDGSGMVLTASAEDNRYTYTGREWDEVLGLYHFRARIYDATEGRFVSRDPIGFNEDGPLLYEYVRAMPLRLHDPYGLQSNANTGTKDDAGNDCPDDQMCKVAICVECGADDWEIQAIKNAVMGGARPLNTGHTAVCWNCKDAVQNHPDVFGGLEMPKSPPQGCSGLYTPGPWFGVPGVVRPDFDRMKKKCGAGYVYNACPDTIEKLMGGIWNDIKDPPDFNGIGAQGDGENCTTWACNKLIGAGIPCPLVVDPNTICNDPNSIKRKKK